MAKRLFENFVCEHGIPKVLHTDQGGQFESDLVKHLCQMLGVHKTRTIHPQCDGMVECFNRTLIDQLAKILQQQQGEWDDYLSQLALAYNTSRHSSTGFTPFFLTHGREARLLTNLLLPNCVPRSPSNLPADYAGDLMCKLQDVFTIATQNREHAYHQQK